MENSSSSISYEGIARGVGTKWGAFTSSRLASPKDRIRRTPQRTTSARDFSFSSNIEKYSEFERNVGKKGVSSSALKEGEVSGPTPRKVKRLELNFSGDEEDSVSDL
jgi:hypothetical protein